MFYTPRGGARRRQAAGPRGTHSEPAGRRRVSASERDVVGRNIPSWTNGMVRVNYSRPWAGFCLVGSPRRHPSCGGRLGISLRQEPLLGFIAGIVFLKVLAGARSVASGVGLYALMESLILAQDERWRRA